MSTRNLAALSNSIFASLGVSGTSDELGIGDSPAARECLLLIDGMGLAAIEKYGHEFPIFSQLHSWANLNSHFPSTTATNISSLGTGVLPGVHGMLGYTVRVPRSGEPGRLLNSLKWDDRVDPMTWQKVPTLFERATLEGVQVSHVAAKRYEGSGFTQAALRGANYRGANQIQDIISSTSSAMQSARSFSYVYLNNLDHAGHEDGVGSEKWLGALQVVAQLISGLIEKLPKGTRLWVTADHGMINVQDAQDKVVLGLDNSLMENVTLLGGEPRARHVYLKEGSTQETVLMWREFFRDRADIYSKAEAISAGLFGTQVSLDSSERMGDLVAIAKGELILIDPDRIKPESEMVGHHGGLTPNEVAIPLFGAVI